MTNEKVRNAMATAAAAAARLPTMPPMPAAPAGGAAAAASAAAAITASADAKNVALLADPAAAEHHDAATDGVAGRARKADALRAHTALLARVGVMDYLPLPGIDRHTVRITPVSVVLCQMLC